MHKTKEIIFVLDPMCSWCWGFEPVVESLIASLPHRIKVSLVLGGLRSQGDQEWNDEFREFLYHHWRNVQHKTGQMFNSAILERDEFQYNTEPSCRAVVTIRALDRTKQFSFFSALQKAFYLHNEDITQDKVIEKIAKEEGIDAEAFMQLFSSEEMRVKTEADAYKARSMGANVFPSLVIIDEEGHLCVMKGYRDYEEVKKLLQM